MIGSTNATYRSEAPTRLLIDDPTHEIHRPDIGRTLQNVWNKSVTYTLSQYNSEHFKIGTEIAFIRCGTDENLNVSIVGTDGIRFGVIGDEIYENAKVTISDFLGMIALRKIEDDFENGDLWVVIGNVEVETT